jgi:hypothetical protein
VGSLGVAAQATDVFGVQCGAGTLGVRADVNDNGGIDGVFLSVQVINPNGRATSRTHLADNGTSAIACLAGGPGQYLVTFHKNKQVGLLGEAYDTIIHCRSSAICGGVETPTTVLLIQNQ